MKKSYRESLTRTSLACFSAQIDLLSFVCWDMKWLKMYDFTTFVSSPHTHINNSIKFIFISSSFLVLMWYCVALAHPACYKRILIIPASPLICCRDALDSRFKKTLITVVKNETKLKKLVWWWIICYLSFHFYGSMRELCLLI